MRRWAKRSVCRRVKGRSRIRISPENNQLVGTSRRRSLSTPQRFRRVVLTPNYQFRISYVIRLCMSRTRSYPSGSARTPSSAVSTTMLSHRNSYSAGSVSAAYGFRPGATTQQTRPSNTSVRDGHSAEYEVPSRCRCLSS